MAGPTPPPSGGVQKKRGSTDETLNVYDDARTYYTAEERHRNNRAGPRTRTYSQVGGATFFFFFLVVGVGVSGGRVKGKKGEGRGEEGAEREREGTLLKYEW